LAAASCRRHRLVAAARKPSSTANRRQSCSWHSELALKQSSGVVQRPLELAQQQLLQRARCSLLVLPTDGQQQGTQQQQ
jgi:hypothetical protein